MGKLFGGSALLLIALFMFIGSRRVVDVSSAARWGALMLTVALPAVAGAGLIASHFFRGRRFAERRERLRQQTLDAEILRIATEREGRLTVLEVVTELAVTPEEAKDLLDRMHARELAELEMTDAGLLVYTFRDARYLGQKSQAKPLLDA